ncbi:MAG: AAA family ATPase, partial [Alphaproteobacteria bacterium]
LGRAHRRDRLAALLWGDRHDKPARHSLRQTLFSIRKVLAEAGFDVLVAEGETVALNATEVDTDVDRLERLTAAGTTEALESAATLCGGVFLEGLSIREEPFEEWLMSERDRLRELALEGLTRLLSRQTETGTRAGIETAVRLLAIDPLQEDVHRVLMRLYVEEGRRGSALKQYEVCARTLRRELGVEPEGETRSLYEEILRQRATRKTAAVDSSAPVEHIPAERKHLTVLFADIVARSLTEAGDPEESRRTLDPLLEAMGDAADRYDATVHRVPGGGLMALFGAPHACEDHAIRACFSALAMRESVTRLGGGEVAVRAGLHSAEVVVRARARDPRPEAEGPAVHLARRLEQLAEPGTILATADTCRLAEDYIQVRSLGSADAEGFGERLALYELTGRTMERTRWEVRAAKGLTRFIGRDAELASLVRPLECTYEGQGQVVAVVGEPGVGKSRLVHEFINSDLTNGCNIVVTGAASHGRNIPYLPFRTMLSSWFEIEQRDSREEIAKKIDDKLTSLDGDLRSLLPAISALLDLPVADPAWDRLEPRERRNRIIAALKTLLLSAAERGPLVVVFEDIHWADSETQSCLDGFIQGLPTAGILLLVTYRPEYRHGWAGMTYYNHCRVDPLPPEAACELLEALLGGDSSLAQLKPGLIRRTEGNPFFLEECVRSLVESEAITGERGAYRLSGDVSALDAPATVHDVLAARIDRLSIVDKRLLQAAAAIGKDVPYTLLKKIAGMSHEKLRQHLANLQAGEFLYETQLFPDIEYTFKHMLTHGVAYGSLLHRQRRELHQQIAEAIETTFGDRLSEQLERLAHHYTEAGCLERGIAYWERAGIAAAERSANQDAISHLTTALDLLGKLGFDTPGRARRELDLLLALAGPLIATTGYGAPEAVDLYTRARELCARLGDTEHFFPTTWGLMATQLSRAEHRQLLETTIQFKRLAEARGEEGFILTGERLLGLQLLMFGRLLEARPHIERTLALYDHKRHRRLTLQFGHNPQAAALCYQAWMLWLLGHPSGAFNAGHEAVAYAEDLGHANTRGLTLFFGGVMPHQFCRDVEAVERYADTLVTFSEIQHLAIWLGFGVAVQGWTMALQGQGEKGISRMIEGFEKLSATGARLHRSYLLGLLAEAYTCTGMNEEAMRVIDEALAFADETDERWWVAELNRQKGDIAASLYGWEKPEVEASYSRAVEVARHQGAKSLELRAAASLATVWQRRGEEIRAGDLLRQIYDRFAEGCEEQDLGMAWAQLAELCDPQLLELLNCDGRKLRLAYRQT